MTERTYLAIDLKSFYASVECMERGLDPMTTNLVVADASRTEKTICLAVSPSLKAYGIPGRARLFEVVQKVKEANCALPGFVDSKNEEKTERNAGYLVVSHSGGGMLRQGTRKGIRRTPANRGMRAHWVVKGLDISEDVCHGMCP